MRNDFVVSHVHDNEGCEAILDHASKKFPIVYAEFDKINNEICNNSNLKIYIRDSCNFDHMLDKCITNKIHMNEAVPFM